MKNKMGQYPHRVTIDISLEEISTHNLWPFLSHRDLQDILKEVLSIGDTPTEELLEKYRYTSAAVLEKGHPTMEKILYPQYTQRYSCVLMHAIKEKYLHLIAEHNVLNAKDFNQVHSMAYCLLDVGMIEEYTYLQNSRLGHHAELVPVEL